MESVDVDVRIEIQKNGLVAVAFIDGADFEPDKAAALVLSQLKSKGVSTPPSQDAIAELLADAPAETLSSGITVAKGTPPQPGDNTRIKTAFPIPNSPMVEGKDPLVLYAGNLVYPGDHLVKIISATQGIGGKSLFGSPLPAPDGKEFKLRLGNGILEDIETGDILASTYGVAMLSRGTISVASALRVAEDFMSAEIDLIPDKRDNASGWEKRILNALKEMHVSKGVDLAALHGAMKKAFQTKSVIHGVLVAKGSEPQDGIESDYEELFDTTDSVGTETEDGRIDFREAQKVTNVKEGQNLAKIIPAIPPVPGFRLDGVELPPQMVQATGLMPGENTTLSKDGTHIIASTDGMLVVRAGQFNVMDEYRIQGDVDYRTGNIRATGSVKVLGQVKPGFVVESTKNIEVTENVEEAELIAKGDINVIGGITNESKINCEGNLETRYILNSFLDVKGDIEVKMSVTNSEVYSKGKITAVGSKGSIMGGEINAADGIHVHTLGSPTAKTRVSVGVDIRVIRELEEIEKETKQLQDKANMTQKNLGANFMKDPKASLMAIPAALRKPKLDMLQSLQDALAKLDEHQKRREELLKRNMELRGAKILVDGEVHAGTVVRISRATVTIKETLRRVELYYESEKDQITWKKV
jgi:uncharacterized protein (DUF342 family)